jgi:hypothetical protein
MDQGLSGKARLWPSLEGVTTMTGTTFALGTGFLTAALALALPAHAQGVPCADHETVMARLATGYGESRQSIGVGGNNTVIEIYANIETGTWTITVTQPEGPTCMVASGYGFEHLDEGLPNTDPGA